MTKYDYACMAAAALAYLVLHQADSVGFMTFDSQVRTFMQAVQPAFASQGDDQLYESWAPAGKNRPCRPSFMIWPNVSRARGLVFILSDMFDEVPDILAGFKHLRHKRHEVILWHILDGAELTFPFPGSHAFSRPGAISRSCSPIRARCGPATSSKSTTLSRSCKRAAAIRTSTTSSCGPIRRSTWRCRVIWRIG